MRTTSYVISDVGKIRSNNEDAFLVREDEGLFVVADGMGGHANGEVASRICVEALAQAYGDDSLRRAVRGRYHDLRRESHYTRPYAEFELRSAVEYANFAIFQTATNDVQFRDMGTTVVALRVCGRRAYLGSVGDSRIYRLREGKLTQLTEDHSLANEYVKLRLLKREDVARFPYKNVIVRALGLGDKVEVDAQWRRLEAGDRFVLCSDGLTDLVRDEEIGRLLGRAATAKEACERLVSRALELGGLDNVTVLAVWVEGNGKDCDDDGVRGGR
jgi:protein phosphatase